MKSTKRLNKVLNNFVSSQDKLAKKYGAKISIIAGGQEVVIADHRPAEQKKTEEPKKPKPVHHKLCKYTLSNGSKPCNCQWIQKYV